MKYYLFAILPNIKILLGFIIVVLFVFAICGLVILAGEQESRKMRSSFTFGTTPSEAERQKEKSYSKLVKVLFILGCVFSLITTFLPNQKQLAFIIAAPYIIENEELQEASKNSAEIIKLGAEYLKQTLTDEIEKNTNWKEV